MPVAVPLSRFTYLVLVSSRKGGLRGVSKVTITIVIEDGEVVIPGTMPKPGPMYVAHIRELILGKINVWDVTLAMPPKTAEDTVKRTLSFNAGHPALANEVVETLELGAAAAPQQVIRVLEGIESTVVSLVDTDNAGNNSPAREFPLSTKDVNPPAQPGELGVVSVEEKIIDVDDEPVPPADGGGETPPTE